MMEYAEHVDFISSGLVVVDDVLLNLNAAATGKESVSGSTGLWVLGEQFKSLNHQGFIRCLAHEMRTTSLRADIRIWFVAPAEPFFNSSVETFDPFRREFHKLAALRLL
jgi:hypothetical protein